MIPVDGTCRIDRMNLAVQCYREVQQEVGIMPHTAIIQIDQIRNSTNLMIFTMMIEPPRTDRYVAFSRQPLVSVFHSPLVLCIMCLLVQRIGRPVCFAGPTGLVADPADIGNRSAEDHRFRMFRFDHFTGRLVAVIGFRIDRTRFIRSTVPAISSVRPVKPELEQRTVVGDQFVDLLMIGLLVSFPPIFGIMAIPGREVKPELQAVLLAGIGQFANHVALSVFIRRVRDIIVDRFGRPKAKAVVVLSCQDHPFQAGRFDDTYPLFAIQVCRIECFRRCIPIAPFQIIECVQPEMHECIILHFLPFDLLRRRNRQNRCGRLYFLAGKK